MCVCIRTIHMHKGKLDLPEFTLCNTEFALTAHYKPLKQGERSMSSASSWPLTLLARHWREEEGLTYMGGILRPFWNCGQRKEHANKGSEPCSSLYGTNHPGTYLKSLSHIYKCSTAGHTFVLAIYFVSDLGCLLCPGM